MCLITNSENSIIYTKYSALVHITKVHSCEFVLVGEFPKKIVTEKLEKELLIFESEPILENPSSWNAVWIVLWKSWNKKYIVNETHLKLESCIYK